MRRRSCLFIHHSSFRVHHLYYRLVKRERVDRLLVERGLAPTRTRAQALVMAGRVLAGERRGAKTFRTLPPGAPPRVRGGGDPAARQGGRGGPNVWKGGGAVLVEPRG